MPTCCGVLLIQIHLKERICRALNYCYLPFPLPMPLHLIVGQLSSARRLFSIFDLKQPSSTNSGTVCATNNKVWKSFSERRPDKYAVTKLAQPFDNSRLVVIDFRGASCHTKKNPSRP